MDTNPVDSFEAVRAAPVFDRPWLEPTAWDVQPNEDAAPDCRINRPNGAHLCDCADGECGIKD